MRDKHTRCQIGLPPMASEYVFEELMHKFIMSNSASYGSGKGCRQRTPEAVLSLGGA
jgi:hypothetical protein